ncbi:MAG: ActD-like protein [Deltaproteobacteria bacterium]|nr:ActD-like protein [Deltaproteobacteria bacterium]
MDTKRPVPDLLVERFVLGEIDPVDRAELEERAAADPPFAAAIETVKRSNDEILAAHPVDETAAAIRSQYERAFREVPAPRKGGALRFAVIPAAALVVAAVGVVVVYQYRDAGTVVPPIWPEVTRAKGDGNRPHLVLRRVTPSGTELLADGAAAKAGDTIQASYSGNGARFGVVVSVDGRGRVTTHLPMSGGDAAALDPRGETPLPQSFELDDAPRFERFFLVTSDRPFKVSVVTAAAAEVARDPEKAAAAALPLEAVFGQVSSILRKATP